MASEIPEYFLPRNWDYPPTGPIKLGNVLTSLKEPHRPLATIKPDADRTIPTSKNFAKIETENEKSGGFAIMTTFLSGLLGAGADAGFDVEKSSKRAFTFDRLDTTYVDTTDPDSENAEKTKYEEYIERCIKAPAVLRYLERKRFRKHVYVITGIKIVSGAKCSTTDSRATEVLAGAQVDGTILSGGMVPMGGGPEIHGGRAKKLKISWEGSTEFVLAFKVSKVRVDQSGKVKREEEYLKGAFLEVKPEKGEPVKLAVDVVKQTSVEEGFSATTVVEGDELIAFGVPEADEGDQED
ncbi:hypothetical protein K458DRAFT_418596 [Lentithecium fluviatile CBS 122367]|uniref:Uncharacterized protein n=1 Tax=Lentithecium fluviatile CBS 122367 TaxID=1168545 RepID=A0A6G1IZE7_9PLEO|nr:hypothetical protein K458DRAFT_418596 [Lentithecium fluviatile CBS 122367]